MSWTNLEQLSFWVPNLTYKTIAFREWSTKEVSTTETVVDIVVVLTTWLSTKMTKVWFYALEQDE